MASHVVGKTNPESSSIAVRISEKSYWYSTSENRNQVKLDLAILYRVLTLLEPI
jgi:hypothetical protein